MFKGRHEEMRFSYNGWNSIMKIMQMAFGLTILFFSFNHGLVQKVQYNCFRRNQANYRVIETTIIDRKTYRLLEGRGKEILEIICVKVSYTIAGNDFVKWVYSYPDMINKEKIKVGVHVRNPQKILRCEPYKINNYEIIVYCLLFLGLMFFMVLDKVCYELYIRMEKNRNLANEQRIEKEQLEKQTVILSSIQVCFYHEQELQQKMTYFKNKGILFNEGTLWVLKNYLNAEKMKKIFNVLLSFDKDKYCHFLEELYEQGLPQNYYILAKHDGNYYCCCKDSEQLYMYSRGLGITHTKYATIYDYIIEQIDKQ